MSYWIKESVLSQVMKGRFTAMEFFFSVMVTCHIFVLFLDDKIY